MFSISAVCAQLGHPGLPSLNKLPAPICEPGLGARKEGFTSGYSACTPRTQVDRLDTDFILEIGSFRCAAKETQFRK
jgi:hypothetical protein